MTTPPVSSLHSPADEARRVALRRMKAIALGALVVMAIVFAVAFVLQETVPAMAWVRAAAEGGMVGALADWFAVTALFRHPLGLRIPHTAIIPRRKDEIGRTLGEFLETNFLDEEVVRSRIESVGVSARVGAWLAVPDNARRVGTEAAGLGRSVLGALGDDDVRELLEDLAREHVIAPEWGPSVGGWLARVVDVDGHRAAVDLAADSIAAWLTGNREVFDGLVSRRLPSWVPSIAHRLVDDTVYREAVAFVDAVRADPAHPARGAIDDYLRRLADDLQHDPHTIGRLEVAKASVFDSPRVRALAADAWASVKNGLMSALDDPESALRRRTERALVEFGERLSQDAGLQHRVDTWLVDAAGSVVVRYRGEISRFVSETVARWDPRETTDKIELLVGRDLQFIRLNGTIVGALAGVAIYTIAHLTLGAALP